MFPIPEACKAYVRALNACLSEYRDTSGGFSYDDLCSEWSWQAYGDGSYPSVARFECYEGVYESADCSTQDGYMAANSDTFSCDNL